MSEVYSLEPSTKGRIIIHTTLGELDIRLWSIQCPKACRNFTQLCLEGYYIGCIFHRLVKNFLVQTGDPTGTGLGGESIYGRGFDNEYHPRLKFRYRGLVGMSNDGTKSSNQSQFFITLDRTDCLNDKYTLFGKIGGHTLYHLIKIGSLETDKNDRPLNPPKIIRIEVLENAFIDIIPRLLDNNDNSECNNGEEENSDSECVPPKSKNIALLSFHDEPNFKSKKDENKDIKISKISKDSKCVLKTDSGKISNKESIIEKVELKSTIDNLKDEIMKIKSRIKTKENNSNNKYTKNKNRIKEDTFEKFDMFVKKLKVLSKNVVDRESEDPNGILEVHLDTFADGSWLCGKGLTFSIDSNKAYELDAARDALKVIDPLESSDNKLDEMRRSKNQRLKPSLGRNKDIEKW